MLLDATAVEGRTRQFVELLDEGNVDQAVLVSREIPPIEVGLIVVELTSDVAVSFCKAAGMMYSAVFLDPLPARRIAKFLSSLPEKEAMDLCRALPANGIADVLVDMDNGWREKFLEYLPEAQSETVKRLSSYENDVVGAIMSSDFIAARSGASVPMLRETIKTLPKGRSPREPFVFVLDAGDCLCGMISWKDLLQGSEQSTVNDIMVTNVVAVRDTDKAMEAAHIYQKRGLSVLPVVNKEDHLVGVVSLEEALELLAQEAVNTYPFCGQDDESTFTPVVGSIRRRLPWMSLNVFLNLGAVAIISGFEETIEELPIIAAFLPMITDMGGNVGIQALSVSIRSIALMEADFSDIFYSIRKEFFVGIINGSSLGVLFGVIVILFEKNWMLALAAGLALGINVLLACLVGGCMPFLVKKCGLDPAMVTGPLLTTITDCTGVIVYLGLTQGLLSYIISNE
ncbi:magnesium transporter [Nitzschia inconspicua]|uniref:Magnesium transporter n=1 Tax=Nitzschia inconspicua TaxID=303405 RepID=A0A9K3LLM7_9STRA|nr:magnesium transporter [Nitzschia inconspicua]